MKTLTALLLAVLAGCAGPDLLTEPGPVVFSAMGCGPYTAGAEKALEEYVAREGAAPRVDFLVHLGDVVSGTFGRNAVTLPDLGESQYAKVSERLGRIRDIPILAVPGDNEWVDRQVPNVGWRLWNRYFSRPEHERAFHRILVRQERRPENFRFVLKGVLFIGINNVTGPAHLATDEWSRCLRDGAAWLKESLNRSEDEVRAAVIFAQSKPSRLLKKALPEAAARFARPILYLQADQHRWSVSEGTLAPGVLHVVTDSMSLRYPAVHVTVTEDPLRPFEFDRELAR